MSPLLHRYRMWLAPLFTFALFGMLLLAIIIPLSAQQAKYENVLRTTEPRIERTQGLIESAKILEDRITQARQTAQSQLFPANVDQNRMNTELQARLRGIAQQNGLTIGSLSTPPPRKERGLEITLINLNLQGDLGALTRVLQNLQQPADGSPALRVDSLTLRRASLVPNAPQTLSIDITLAALRPASSPTSAP